MGVLDYDISPVRRQTQLCFQDTSQQLTRKYAQPRLDREQ